MLDAAIAGIPPDRFYQLTLGEIFVVIEGYQEREKNNLIGRINAILRAFTKKGSPYKGLKTGGKEEVTQGSLKRAAEAWLWR